MDPLGILASRFMLRFPMRPLAFYTLVDAKRSKKIRSHDGIMGCSTLEVSVEDTHTIELELAACAEAELHPIIYRFVATTTSSSNTFLLIIIPLYLRSQLL